MARLQRHEATVREICVDPQPIGLRAVYLVETRSADETRAIAKLFSELKTHVQVRQLCKGKLVSYVVQAHKSDASLLDDVENILKSDYAFVVSQGSFDDVIYRIVKELAEDTGSSLLPMSHCHICGKTEPFATTVVNLSDEDGSVLISRHYCSSCTAEAGAPSNKQFVRSLLAADRRDFGGLVQAELVRRRSREHVRFKIKSTDRETLARAG